MTIHPKTSLRFICCECRRHIIVVNGPLPDPRLCSMCMTFPGWMRVPEIRRIVDPKGMANTEG